MLHGVFGGVHAEACGIRRETSLKVILEIAKLPSSRTAMLNFQGVNDGFLVGQTTIFTRSDHEFRSPIINGWPSGSPKRWDR